MSSEVLLTTMQLERLIPPGQVGVLADYVYSQFSEPSEVVAREGNCYYTASRITTYLREQHGVSSARTEIHTMGSLVHQVTTVPHPGRNGELDTVFDATWQQFLPESEQDGRHPLLFAGPRIGMIALVNRLNRSRDLASRPPRGNIYSIDTIYGQTRER